MRRAIAPPKLLVELTLLRLLHLTRPLDAAAAVRSLEMAIAQRRPAPGLVVHSDRGSQYCSRNYQKLLKQFGLVPSMSRKGNCYDNAPMESWFGTLKSELTHHQHYRTRHEAIREIVEYIEVFYNRQRRHAKLGNISPAEFERKFYRSQQAA